MRLISRKEISLIAESNKEFMVETFIKIQGGESDQDTFENLNAFLKGYEAAIREYADEDYCASKSCHTEIYNTGRQTAIERILQLVRWERSREIFHLRSKFDDLMPKTGEQN